MMKEQKNTRRWMIWLGWLITMGLLLSLTVMGQDRGGNNRQWQVQGTLPPDFSSKLDALLQMLVNSPKPPGRMHQPLQPQDLTSPRLAEMVKALSSIIRIDSPTTGRRPPFGYTIPVILHLRPGANLGSIQALGCTVRARISDVAAVDVPLQVLEQVAVLSEIVYVEASQWYQLCLDTSAEITRANRVRLINDHGTPIDPRDDTFTRNTLATGRGVVIAVIDTGIDRTHPTFREINGKRGSERFVIIDGSPENDSDGHGTHVASIAAGSGLPIEQVNRNQFHRLYVGIAPGASILPLGGGTNGNVNFPVSEADVLTYLRRIANAVSNSPVVVNMSFGHTTGPHDGSEGVEKAIDSFVSESPGRAVVVSAGNDAASRGHFEGEVDPSRPLNERLLFASQNNNWETPYIDVWYNSEAELNVTLTAPDGRSYSANEGQNLQSDDDKDGRYNISISWESPSNLSPGSDRLVIAFPQRTNGQWQLMLSSRKGRARVFIWSNDIESGRPTITFTHPTSSTTINSPGNARLAITVGAHTNGRLRDLAHFSGRGPTRDGRIKPDITAPGAAPLFGRAIVAARSQQSRLPRLPNRSEYWTEMQGTSMAAPHVTGAIALMLERNRDLTIHEIISILRQTADRPLLVGLPNNDWGWGRLNIEGAVQLSSPRDRPTLQILSPTGSRPAIAGPYDNPRQIWIRVAVRDSSNRPIRNLTQAHFAVFIGEKEATVTSVCENLGSIGNYYLEIRKPPNQDQAGQYDLHVYYLAGAGRPMTEALADAIESGAIIYTEPVIDKDRVDLVLIIDSSGSMELNDPYGTRRQHAKRFIDFARIGDRIGVVKFTTTATILAGLIEIRSNNDRQILKNAIDQIGDEWTTNIEDGLWKGLQVLNQGGDVGNRKVAILLTDGFHNEGPIGEAIKEYTKRSIPLYAIALTGEADEFLLKSYAEQTGAKYLKAPSASELEQIWREIIGAAIGERPILASSFSIKQGETKEQIIPVDSSQEVLVAGITWSGSLVKLNLIRPDGTAVDPSDPSVEYNSGSDFEIYRVHNPMPGQWTTRVEGIETPAIGTQVKLTVATVTPLFAEAFPVKTTYSKGEAILVAISLFEGSNPVIGAQVEAKITKPGGKISKTRILSSESVERDPKGRIPMLAINVLNRQAGTFDDTLPLFDDGLHNDGDANDGVYANVYSATNVEGTYIFNITAIGKDSRGFDFRRELLITADVKGELSPIFSVDPVEIDLGTVFVGANGAVAESQSIRIVNESSETQSILITASELLGPSNTRLAGGHISISPDQFELAPGEGITINVSLTLPSSVTSGDFVGNLVIMGNTQSQQVPLRAKLQEDNQKPLIANIKPVANSVLIGPQFLTMTLEDDCAGVFFDGIAVSVNGQRILTMVSYASQTKVLTVELADPNVIEGNVPLPPGHYKVEIEIPDRALNRERVTLDLEIAELPQFPSGIGMFTVPFVFDNPSLEIALSNPTFPTAVWDNAKKDYVLFDQFVPGRAFWAKFNDVFIPDFVQRGISLSQSEPFVIPLRAGWNMIGSVFLKQIPWDVNNIKVRRNGTENSLAQAQRAGWIEDYAWGWEQDENDPFKGRYVLVYNTSIIPGVQGYLEPWKGYWVYAHQDCELILPPPSTAKGRGTGDEGRVAKGNGWVMKLVAKVGDESGEAILGVSQGSRGLAVGLPPEPPEGSSNVQVILLNNGAPLAVDVRNGIRQRQEWDVVVKFGTRSGGRGTRQNKEVTLTFDGVGYATKDVSLWLVDMVTGKRLYMRTQSAYRFVPNEGETTRKFKVIAEMGNERPLQVVGLKAVPMRGRSLAIQFVLTKPAQTQVEIMTLTGRKVAVLEAGQSRKAGQQQIVWQGDGKLLPASAYLVLVIATDEEGRQVQAVTTVRMK